MTMPTKKAVAPDGNYRIGQSTIRNVRVEDTVWSAAGDRAATEGTNLSELIRQWLTDYAETGSPLARGRRPKVRLTAAERDAIRDSLGGLDIAGIVVDTINKERE